MKKPAFTIMLFCCTLIFSSCEDQSYVPDVSSIDLLRGELLLCSPEQFGEVRFSLECEYESREAFDLAISLLHSFEYIEAEKVFVSVIDMDPECAMAYWGVAMSNYHALWAPPNDLVLEKGAAILKSAELLKKTDREQEYFNAIAAYYSDWETLDDIARTQRFEKKMEKIYLNHPEDKEAAIFYSLALKASADPNDKTYANQRKAGEILESLFPDQPNHPGIAHYIIHNYDHPELAALALPTARKYADIAPSSAHAQHMPSHIFTRLGLWDESISSNINSTESALCYSESSGMEGHWKEELHGMDYLVYAYLQKGDNAKAMEQSIYLSTIEQVFPENIASSYAIAAIPVRIILENKDWEAAVNMEMPSIDLPWENFPWQSSLITFTRALGACHTGDLEMANIELAKLQSNREKLLSLSDEYKANQLLIQKKTIEAWIAKTKGDNEFAIQEMEEAAHLEDLTGKHPVTPGEVLPARELLGDLYLELNMPDKAIIAYREDLEDHPNRFNGIYGSAKAYEAIGDYGSASLYFQMLTSLCSGVESDRPELEEAKAFLILNPAKEVHLSV